MLGPFNEDKRYPLLYLFKVMHLLGNVSSVLFCFLCFVLFLVAFFSFFNTNVLPPLVFVQFQCQKGYMGSIYQKNAVNLLMETAMEP